MKITLIGLGNSENDLTKKAELALKNASKIIARTAFASLKNYEVETLDKIFLSSRNFDTLNKNLATFVLNAAKLSEVCYCVDGAVCEDEACRIILKKHPETEVIEGVAKSAHAASIARLSSSQYCAVSAYDIGSLKSSPAAVVYDVDCDYIASLVKERLSDLFGEESGCVFVRGESATRIKIFEIDRQKDYDLTCAVAVEEGDFLKKERYDYADLEKLIKLLRAPNGCPWDRVQTNESIKGNTVEEAYELADAIERGDDDGIEEETGDVLLQAAFHSVIKEEQGVFSGTDAITRLVKKLIFRHSHIFGKDKAKDGDEALSVWEKNKLVEKHMSTFGESVQAVPANFPACMYAQKVGKRAAKSGMDFLSPVSAFERLQDEFSELIDAMQAEDKEHIFEEAGDVLFAAVNTCRLAGVDCENALRMSAKKFAKRFVKCEQLIIADGKDMTDLNGLELDLYWERAKDAVNKD
ncbi:MAG: nucleoside triphosphate pyrophosphohydrolase [Clostridia bacterium]|nr:nucleoside triphosphate pyrophosphohydrolase [Clostridia bacterium]